MKRPEITTVFGGTKRVAPSAAVEIARMLTDNGRGLLSRYFADVRLNVDDGCYEFSNEVSDLAGLDDLQQRIRSSNSGMWSMQVNTAFLSSDVYVAVYSEDEQTHVVLSMDGYVTAFLEDESTPRRSYLELMCKLAQALGSDWFVCGLGLEDWRPLRQQDMASRTDCAERFGQNASIYFCGWRNDVMRDESIAAGWSVDPAEVFASLSGYRFISPLGAV